MEENIKAVEKSYPICDTCNQLITYPLNAEKYTYKTLTGEIKAVWCCIDCQLEIYSNENEAGSENFT